jgi:WD40 repeat protein
MLTRNGTKAVTISGDHTARLWDVVSGRTEKLLEGHGDEVKALALTSRGRFLVTGSMDGTARLWDLAAPGRMSEDIASGVNAGGVLMVASVPPGAAGQEGAGDDSSNHSHSSGRGGRGVTLGADGVLRVYDARGGACIAVGHAPANSSSQPRWVSTTKDGCGALTASGDRCVVQWDLSSGEPRELLPAQLGSRTKSVAFDGAGKRVAVVLWDSSVVVWDLEAGSCLAQLIKRGERDPKRVHSGGVNQVLLTRDGQRAVTVSKDCTARLWDVAAASCCAVLKVRRCREAGSGEGRAAVSTGSLLACCCSPGFCLVQVYTHVCLDTT